MPVKSEGSQRRRSLVEFFLELERHAGDVAFTQREGYRSVRWSYRELAGAARQFARELEARGVGAGDRVLLWGKNSAEWVAAFWGCVLRGAVVVPMDEVASADFARRVARQVEARLLAGSRGQAKLDPATFASVEPRWLPPGFADRRAAWEGRYPDAPEIPIRVEAASFHGRPIALRIVEPWTPAAVGPAQPGWVRSWEVVPGNWIRVAHIGFHFSLLLGLGLLARRNLRTGRGDRRFAFRLAAALFVLVMLQWLLGSHHVPERSEFELFFGGLYRAFFAFGLGWLFYIVLEPYARRLWPRALISWVRLLDGRVRDPQLGRDVLIGCVLGVGYSVLLAVNALAPAWRGGVPLRPDLPHHPATLLALSGVREGVAEMLAVVVNITTHVLFLFVALLLLRFLLRRTWLAVAAHWVGYVLVYASAFGLLPIACWITLWHILFFRYGWVTILVGTFTADLLLGFPLTSDLSAWHAHTTFLAAGACLALAGYGFRVSLGRRPAFSDLLAER